MMTTDKADDLSIYLSIYIYIYLSIHVVITPRLKYASRIGYSLVGIDDSVIVMYAL